MKKNLSSKSGIFNPRALVAFALCLAGVGLTMLSFAANPPNKMTRSAAESPGGPVWAIVNSPNAIATPNYDNVHLSSVTCASASECWAVGEHGGSGPYYAQIPNQTLIEQWDGTQWSIVTSPSNPSVNGGNYLNGVTCAS